MPLESATYFDKLNETYPTSADSYQITDNHIRLIKKTIQNVFPYVRGIVNATQDDFNKMENVDVTITSVQSSIHRVSANLTTLEDDVDVVQGLMVNLSADDASIDSRLTDLEVLENTLSATSYPELDTRVGALSSTLAAIVNTFYVGRVDLSGTAISLPSSWLSVQIATSDYQVSHFLSIPTTYGVLSEGHIYSIQANHFRVKNSSSFSFVVVL